MPDRALDALEVISESLNLLPGNFKALRTRGRIHVSVSLLNYTGDISTKVI
jgi:hypothetical protein